MHQKEGQSQSDNKFSNFEENSSIKHLIEIDAERTYGDTKLFQDEYIRRMEEDILYVFAQENKPTSYKQGMNEILAIFIHAFYPFYISSPIKQYNSQLFDNLSLYMGFNVLFSHILLCSILFIIFLCLSFLVKNEGFILGNLYLFLFISLK